MNLVNAKTLLTKKEERQAKDRIESLEYENKMIQHEIDSKKYLNPWYPTHNLNAKMGNNTRKIKHIRGILNGSRLIDREM